MQVIVYTCVLNVVVGGMKLSSTRPRLPHVNTFSLTRAHTMLSPQSCISSALVGLQGEPTTSKEHQGQKGTQNSLKGVIHHGTAQHTDSEEDRCHMLPNHSIRGMATRNLTNHVDNHYITIFGADWVQPYIQNDSHVRLMRRAHVDGVEVGCGGWVVGGICTRGSWHLYLGHLGKLVLLHLLGLSKGPLPRQERVGVAQHRL